MTEICKLCKQPSTPWSYVEPLKGHICCECSYRVDALFPAHAWPSAEKLYAAYGTEDWNRVQLP